jgi:SAM-dependent methyltransferase
MSFMAATTVSAPPENGPAPSQPELPPFDKYDLYTKSVQAPQRDARFFERAYREARGPNARARVLREDFCGTFVNSCTWVTRSPDNYAIGIDLDPEPLEYGRTHYWERLKPLEQARVQILQENVLADDLPTADIIVALNYSYWIFKARAELLEYLRNCHRRLERDGLLVLDCYGGPQTHRPNTEARHDAYDRYSYFFEEERFDPLTNEALFHIHFNRWGESKRLKVFTYDWRAWTVPELRDALLEVGFTDVHTYWEGTTAGGDGDLDWKRMARVRDEADSWGSYLVALR